MKFLQLMYLLWELYYNSASHHSNIKDDVKYLKTVYGNVKCNFFLMQEKKDVEYIECVEQKIAQN